MIEKGGKQVTASAKVIVRVKIGCWLLGQNRRADAVEFGPGELQSQHLTHRWPPRHRLGGGKRIRWCQSKHPSTPETPDSWPEGAPKFPGGKTPSPRVQSRPMTQFHMDTPRWCHNGPMTQQPVGSTPRSEGRVGSLPDLWLGKLFWFEPLPVRFASLATLLVSTTPQLWYFSLSFLGGCPLTW